MTRVVPSPSIVQGFDPLRDVRHKSARSARDQADWLAWLELGGHRPRTLRDYEWATARLLKAHPHTALDEFTASDIAHVLRSFPPAGRRTKKAAYDSWFRWGRMTERKRTAARWLSTPYTYEDASKVLLRETGCTVRKYRKNNSGTAYTKSDDWGIEVPQPRGPVSFGVFAHEVGHQNLHRHGSAPRWLEEIEAWEYALTQFDRFGLKGQDKVRAKAAKSILWACVKASRRCSPESARNILIRVPDWVGDLAGGGPLWADLFAKAEGVPS